jgi:ABC-2 type transport system ATP-binding protein
MIMATPYLDEAERCTRVALLHEGRLLAQDQPSRLQAQTEGKMAEVVVDRPRDAMRALRGHMDPDRVQLFGDRLHVRLDPDDSPEALGARLADIGVAATAIRAIVPTLEDVFIERLGRSARGAQVVTNPE